MLVIGQYFKDVFRTHSLSIGTQNALVCKICIGNELGIVDYKVSSAPVNVGLNFNSSYRSIYFGVVNAIGFITVSLNRFAGIVCIFVSIVYRKEVIGFTVACGTEVGVVNAVGIIAFIKARSKGLVSVKR